MDLEKLNQNQEASPNISRSGFDALSSVEFDPKRAKSLKTESAREETDTEGTPGSENVPSSDSKDLSLAAFHEEKLKPAGELSPAEAAKEYLDILYDLSLGFESAEGQTGAAAEFNRNGELQVANRSGYSGKEKRAVSKLVSNLESTDNAAKFADRELSLDMADKLIFGQAIWQAASEKFDPKAESYDQNWGKTYIEKAEQSKNNLIKYEVGIGGTLRRVFRRKEYENLKNEALRDRRNAEPYIGRTDEDKLKVQTRFERATRFGNKLIEDTLLEAYSPDYGYGHHKLAYGHDNPEYRAKVNEEYNNKFFSVENAEKIARAIELRNRLYPDSVQIDADSSFERFKK